MALRAKHVSLGCFMHQIYFEKKAGALMASRCCKNVVRKFNQEGGKFFIGEVKIDERNKPRIFANAFKMKDEESSFSKSIFTLCDYRENDKCPPWSIQASEMLHDRKKKTIYYDNAVIKVYDIPIFYLPRLSHPDPTVDRRSGFLPPSFSDSKNLGAGVSIP